MRYSALVLAFAFVWPLTGAAQITQSPGSQILVSECNPHLHTAAEAHPWVDPYGTWHYSATNFPSWDAFLAISYHNTASTPASEVDFGLVVHGSLVAIAKDVGTFSPGVQIDHEFVISREIFPLGAGVPYCAVIRVKYADGGVWLNPIPPQE